MRSSLNLQKNEVFSIYCYIEIMVYNMIYVVIIVILRFCGCDEDGNSCGMPYTRSSWDQVRCRPTLEYDCVGRILGSSCSSCLSFRCSWILWAGTEGMVWIFSLLRYIWHTIFRCFSFACRFILSVDPIFPWVHIPFPLPIFRVVLL